MTKKIAVFGGAGVTGNQICKQLKADGHYVVSYDRQHPPGPREEWPAQEYHIFDLTNHIDYFAAFHFNQCDEVYLTAAACANADGEETAEILVNRAMVNLNVLEACRKAAVQKVHIRAVVNQPDSLWLQALYAAYREKYQMKIRIFGS